MRILPSSASLFFLSLLVASGLFFVGCPTALPEPVVYELSHDDLMDPETCRQCHASHVEEWESSMHAYAGRDPVFLAMNARGQRETDGALGDFCLRCHVPLAVSAGVTTDGLNLDDVDDNLKGVNCYFCHTVKGTAGDANNPLLREDDDLMRGAIPAPIENSAHAMVFSPMHDRKSPLSSTMCGSCHDVVNGHGVRLEATFAEWKDSLFGRDGPEGLSCGDCHMKGRDAPIVGFADAPVRRMHSHLFAAVDVALDDVTPGQELQRAEIQRSLDTTLFAEVCVENVGGGTEIQVTLENFAAGHSFPSGASMDRRAWVEVEAFLGTNAVFQSGVVDAETSVHDAALADPQLWQFRSTVFAEGEEVHMFWNVDEKQDALLLGAQGINLLDPKYEDVHQSFRYFYVGLLPDEVKMAVHLRPIGLDVLDDLVQSGDLEQAVKARMPTFTLRSTELTWKQEDGLRCFPPRR
ncbi:MAG: hypothetical protein GY822_12555 [Deltaproteobacteria bacterium]|nr:hypothetical protein [Deltaproteobacteria bacterium]